MKIIFKLILAATIGIAVGVTTASLRVAMNPWDGNPPVAGDNTPYTLPAPAQERSNLDFDSSVFDFGSLDTQTKASHVFRIRNAGTATLKISKGETSCKCVVGDLDRTEIPPGETADITITLETNQRLGQFRETATFFSNDPLHPRFDLEVSGQIKAKVWAVPAELIFNQITADEPATRQIRLLCYQEEPWQVLEYQWEVAETARYYQFDYLPLTAGQIKEEPDAKSGYMLRVTVKPGLPYGAFQQKILIKTNLEIRPEISIPIQGTVVGDITVAGPGWNADQDVVYLGTINSRQGFRQRMLLIVRGAYRKEVKFKPIENPVLPVKLSLGETSEINNGLITHTPMIIEIPKGSRPVNHLGGQPSDWGEITIETTHPKVPKLRFFVRFAVVE